MGGSDEMSADVGARTTVADTNKGSITASLSELACEPWHSADLEFETLLGAGRHYSLRNQINSKMPPTLPPLLPAMLQSLYYCI